MYAVQRDYIAAVKILDQQDSSGTETPTLYKQEAQLMYLVDQGRWREAIAHTRQLQQIAKTESPELVPIYRGMELSLRSYLPDANLAADLKTYAADIERNLAQGHKVLRTGNLVNLLAAGVMAARHGDLLAANTIQNRIRKEALQSEQPKLISMVACLESEILLAQGKAKQALAVLNPHIQAGHELYYTHALRLRALMALGQDRLALQEAEWLIAYRGRAYVERNNNSLWAPSNIAESNLALRAAADIEKRLGRFTQAEFQLQQFKTVWPDSDAQTIARLRASSLAR